MVTVWIYCLGCTEKIPPRFRKKMEQQNQGFEGANLTTGASDGNYFNPSLYPGGSHAMGNGVAATSAAPMRSTSPNSSSPSPPLIAPTPTLGGKNEEISLRPVRMPTFRPNIPNMLPRSAQMPVFRPGEVQLNLFIYPINYCQPKRQLLYSSVLTLFNGNL